MSAIAGADTGASASNDTGAVATADVISTSGQDFAPPPRRTPRCDDLVAALRELDKLRAEGAEADPS